MKTMLCITAGAVVSAVAQIFGGWSFGLAALLILMGIDFVSGLVVAGVFHASKKSASGRIESHAALKGLIRKVMIISLVVAAHIIDRLLGTNYLRDAVVIGFIVNEMISIFENAGLMGIPLPAVLINALEALQKKNNADQKAKTAQPGEPNPWTLEGTAALMTSDSYKDRFVAEYRQVVIRRNKLFDMLRKWENGELGFEPNCDRDLLEAQLRLMDEMIPVLERRAEEEGVDLTEGFECWEEAQK